MSQERLMTVLLGPHVSEKGTVLAEKNNQVIFRVRRDANKEEIRKAVELMFEVKVEGVQVLNQHGKTKRFGRLSGKRADWKKAYVRLAEGQSIDFLGAD
ncbi:MAG: 50S ribosomal protein L23 [Gammaproteobacteria bacterium]|jgi:large subunit ribosomal protein L23